MVSGSQSFISILCQHEPAPNGSLVFYRHQLNIGINWEAFVSNLKFLENQGRLAFNIDTEDGYKRAVVHMNAPNIESTHQKICWQPSEHSIKKLKQYGLKEHQIKGLSDEFNAQTQNKSDSSFISFCLMNSKVVNQHLTPSRKWKPDAALVSLLTNKGIDEGILQEYLQIFLKENAIVYEANWNVEFERFCLHRWLYDSRNPECPTPTLMSEGWSASDNVLKELSIRLDLTDEEIFLKMLEYRIYWTERGEMRANWNLHFRNWMLRSNNGY